MVEPLKKVFRSLYYMAYGGSGKVITINGEPHTVSAHVARGIRSVIDEVPLKLLGNLVKDAHVVFDIGANVGVIALIIAKKMKPSSTVYSFEPGPTAYKYLTDNARVQKGNAKIVPVNLAVSNSSEPIRFTNNDDDSCTNHISTGNERDVITMQATTVDIYCKQHNVVPQVMKVDIEGAEYWALQGMRETLQQNNCAVLMEIHRNFLADNKIDGKMFAEIIDGVGYKMFNTKGVQINSDEIVKNSCVIIARERPADSVFAI